MGGWHEFSLQAYHGGVLSPSLSVAAAHGFLRGDAVPYTTMGGWLMPATRGRLCCGSRQAIRGNNIIRRRMSGAGGCFPSPRRPQRQQLPASDDARALPGLRRAEDAWEAPAQLNRSGHLTMLLVDGTDGSGLGLCDGEHAWRMGLAARAQQAIAVGLRPSGSCPSRRTSGMACQVATSTREIDPAVA